MSPCILCDCACLRLHFLIYHECNPLASPPPLPPLPPCLLPQVPEPGTDYSLDARVVLTQLLGGGRPLLAHVVARERADPKAKHPKVCVCVCVRERAGEGGL